MSARRDEVELLTLAAALQIEECGADGDEALKAALGAIEVLVEVTQAHGFAAVAEGLHRAARREPRGVGLLCGQALVELAVARNGGPA